MSLPRAAKTQFGEADDILLQLREAQPLSLLMTAASPSHIRAGRPRVMRSLGSMSSIGYIDDQFFNPYLISRRDSECNQSLSTPMEFARSYQRLDETPRMQVTITHQ